MPIKKKDLLTDKITTINDVDIKSDIDNTIGINGITDIFNDSLLGDDNVSILNKDFLKLLDENNDKLVYIQFKNSMPFMEMDPVYWVNLRINKKIFKLILQSKISYMFRLMDESLKTEYIKTHGIVFKYEEHPLEKFDMTKRGGDHYQILTFLTKVFRILQKCKNLKDYIHSINIQNKIINNTQLTDNEIFYIFKIFLT